MSVTRFFKDTIQGRCVLLETAGDIFAADIKQQPNCFRHYLLKFKQEVQLIVNDEYNFTKNEDTEQILRDILEQQDLQHYATLV